MDHSGDRSHKQDSGIYINNLSGQVNVSKDQSVQNPSYVVGNNEEKEEELCQELERLIALLEKETQLDQSMRTELDFTSRALLEDVRAKQLSTNRMSKLHQLLEKAMPEMQFTSTVAGVCSAITDLIGK